jgi:hypothetical protein
LAAAAAELEELAELEEAHLVLNQVLAAQAEPQTGFLKQPRNPLG